MGGEEVRKYLTSNDDSSVRDLTDPLKLDQYLRRQPDLSASTRVGNSTD